LGAEHCGIPTESGNHCGNNGVTEEIEEMASRAEGKLNAIVYGTFYRYPRDDA
jgi:hypothetical protein